MSSKKKVAQIEGSAGGGSSYSLLENVKSTFSTLRF